MGAFIQVHGVYVAMWVGLWLLTWPCAYWAVRLALRHEKGRP